MPYHLLHGGVMAAGGDKKNGSVWALLLYYGCLVSHSPAVLRGEGGQEGTQEAGR